MFRRRALSCTLLFALAIAAPAMAKERVGAFEVPASGVIGVEEAQLNADYWIARLSKPAQVLMTPAQIAAQNDRLFGTDPSMHALGALPDEMSREYVLAAIGKLSKPPSRELFFADGSTVGADWFAQRTASLALDAVPATQRARFGAVVRRASLRTFPDATRVFADADDHDIDRFQESALFIGAPVAILHASRDGRWLFVVAPNYAAWIEADAVAIGERATVLASFDRPDHYRMILGAHARTVYTPEEPRVSTLDLEMGQRLPMDPSMDQAVNGQNAYTSWRVLLPVRESDGALALKPALLPKTQDSAAAPLPFTRANLLRQAFKFLGERYGWGHDYGGRDCSGFVGEVYRSVGVELPRNTGDQSRSPVLRNRTVFGPRVGRDARERALAATRPGDLLFIPGHLMMVLGHVDGKLYVIHDIEGGSWLDAKGELQRMHLNGVSVTPFAPLRFDQASDFTDKLTAILRIP
jgi:cell wall-associated NlpC family hydrolase